VWLQKHKESLLDLCCEVWQLYLGQLELSNGHMPTLVTQIHCRSRQGSDRPASKEAGVMNTLIVFNHLPYDGTDVTWNGLRLADKLLDTGMEVRLFLMNDSVDLARDAAKPPGDYFNLGQMLKDLIPRGVVVKVCGTCKARCGLHKNEPYFDATNEATMAELAEWVGEADRIITL